jgi:CheY-like chemotaxis protein
MSSSDSIPKLVQEGTNEEFLLTKGETLIGRASGRGGQGEAEVNISLADGLVSRKHAIITADKQGYYIRNFGRNGTEVNGRQVQIAYINSGDEIRIGNTVFHFLIGEEEEDSSSIRLALIVDHEIENVKRLQEILEAENFGCIAVSNGMEAIEELQQKRFSLVITEICVSKLDGFELCRSIRNHPGWGDLTIIILTHLSHAPEVDHGLRQGADFYWSKPLAPGALRECLKKLRGERED